MYSWLMPRYIIFVIDNGDNRAVADEVARIDAFNAKLIEQGNWIFAAGIKGPESGMIFDNRDSINLNKVGSLFESPEHYSGFWIIQADSDELAQDLSKQGSLACNRRVELRPFIF